LATTLAAFPPLPRSFYARPPTVVAPDCLGKVLVYQSASGTFTGRIVEAEAYLGFADLAAHSRGGRRTARNEVMYGPPGHAYVFLIYGLHYHFNLVTDAPGIPTAALVRAVEPILGEPLMRERRRVADRRQLTNGPGKLCQAFAIDLAHNGVDLCRPPLYMADGEPPKHILRTPRIGVDYARHWAKRLLRFVDPDSAFLSRHRPVRRASS